ncbi:MAG: hypothetical protein F4Z34_08250 [Acidimicrobiaceae bacterium]|nr:hypothetical protein [Acidimicrobiaceae bacterium]
MFASTRAVRLRGDKHITRLTPQALEGAAAQINDQGIPFLMEHLGFLPPRGYFDRAWVRDTEDGECELCAELSPIPSRLVQTDFHSKIDLTALPLASAEVPSIEITYDRRNFDPQTLDEIERSTSESVRPEERWAELPPLCFELWVPVLWGASVFATAFFKRLGTLCADAVHSKFSSWVASTARKSKDPTRSITVGFVFEYPDRARLSGFILAPVDEITAAVDAGFERIEDLAAIAGVQAESNIFPKMRRAAYFFHDGTWHLGWWTDGTNVSVTPWFRANPPDAAAALGRPLIDRDDFGGIPLSFGGATERQDDDTTEDDDS